MPVNRFLPCRYTYSHYYRSDVMEQKLLLFLNKEEYFISFFCLLWGREYVNLAAIDNWVSTASDLFIGPSLPKRVSWLLEQQIRNEKFCGLDSYSYRALRRPVKQWCLSWVLYTFHPFTPNSHPFGIPFDTEFINIIFLCIILQRVPRIKKNIFKKNILGVFFCCCY